MSKTSHGDLNITDLVNLVQVINEAENAGQIFTAVAEAAQRQIGYKLITIMAFDEDTMRVQRLYTNNPDVYPLGGDKGKRDTAWGRHVLIEGRPFIGRTAADIRANFNDHEVISELGLESILNMPVRIYGRTIGTMNMLHEAAFYDKSDLEWASFLAAQLIGPLCMHANE